MHSQQVRARTHTQTHTRTQTHTPGFVLSLHVINHCVSSAAETTTTTTTSSPCGCYTADKSGCGAPCNFHTKCDPKPGETHKCTDYGITLGAPYCHCNCHRIKPICTTTTTTTAPTTITTTTTSAPTTSARTGTRCARTNPIIRPAM